MSDTVTQPAALERSVDEDGFIAATGVSRIQASRIVGAVLGVIGASMPDGQTPSQGLSLAINVIGMAAAEAIAGAGADPQGRTELIGSLNSYVAKNVDELARQYQAAAAFAQMVQQTTNGQGITEVAPELKPN